MSSGKSPHNQGRARTQSPTTINFAVEILTFGEFGKVNKAESAMAKSHSRRTTVMIMVSPLPGKYELLTEPERHWLQQTRVSETVRDTSLHTSQRHLDEDSCFRAFLSKFSCSSTFK